MHGESLLGAYILPYLIENQSSNQYQNLMLQVDFSEIL